MNFCSLQSQTNHCLVTVSQTFNFLRSPSAWIPRWNPRLQRQTVPDLTP
jgi:hypothetical protein